MAKAISWTYSIAWGNPYTEPAPGQPRLLAAEKTAPGAPCPAHLEALRIGNKGYTCQISFELPPIKRWPQERKAAARQQNLKRRINRDAPLFADELLARELEAHPDYFNAV